MRPLRRLGKRIPGRSGSSSAPPQAITGHFTYSTFGDTMGSSVLRIAMNGVTGRMGYRQHLLRSILPIRDAGGVQLPDGSRVQVEPILVGRNEAKLAQIAREHGVEAWTTDVDAVIGDPSVDIYFDAQVTSRREAVLSAAIKAGKHIY